MSDHVAGKVVVVTGAGSGFGRLICQKAAARGARVVGADIDEAGLAETAGRLTDAEVLVRRTDVSDLADMKALVAAAEDRFGTVDVLVNNAGTMPLAFFRDHEAAIDAWNRCLDVNVRGVLNGMVAVHDGMLARGRGQVVNLSSIYGNFPVVGAAVYGATKAAVDFLSESFRVEARGVVKVTVVKPTGVPATGLAGGIVNPEAVIGIYAQNAGDLEKMEPWAAGQLPAEELDPESPRYFALDPEHVADAVLHAIDQPWGVSIGSITVRATGDGYIL